MQTTMNIIFLFSSISRFNLILTNDNYDFAMRAEEVPVRNDTSNSLWGD